MIQLFDPLEKETFGKLWKMIQLLNPLEKETFGKALEKETFEKLWKRTPLETFGKGNLLNPLEQIKFRLSFL